MQVSQRLRQLMNPKKANQCRLEQEKIPFDLFGQQKEADPDVEQIPLVTKEHRMNIHKQAATVRAMKAKAVKPAGKPKG